VFGIRISPALLAALVAAVIAKGDMAAAARMLAAYETPKDVTKVAPACSRAPS
jgi:hypothetical protein